MRNYHKRVDKIIETMVSQRRQLMKTSKADDLPKDLLQVLLSREATDQKKSDDQNEFLRHIVCWHSYNSSNIRMGHGRDSPKP
ncbi:hypothetical protein GOP47_0019728 [Adiantum capillus-veneris]|uniref:Uncharacterized protein n=1 Tax=Adiantum capillus-veneris TaxID=13818 RepID=A0A9D4Z7B7_ADICA|nr:hypothetical protein GOP47_0019728 [Adiantum capillus-veneris]